MLYTFFWVIPRHLNLIYRRFGTLCLFHLHRLVGMKNFGVFILQHSSYLPAYEDGTDRVFRNVGIYNSDAGELPRRKHTTLWTFLNFFLFNARLISPTTYVLYLGKYSAPTVSEPFPDSGLANLSHACTK